MGGSSGGSSGKVEYPDYMQTKHEDWLDEMDTFISAATNPYTSATAYSPDTALSENATKIALFNDAVQALDPDSDWSGFWTVAQNKLEADVFSDALIDSKVAAYSASILARLSQDILPIYQRGMQDVRAVMTSAFTIGEALLTADTRRDIDKFEADLKRDNETKKNELISHAADAMLQSLQQTITAQQALTSTVIESNRIKIVAKQEENDGNVEYDEKEALWDFELYTYAGNLMASIAGAASATTGKKTSKAASAIGGALSGAAAGAQMGTVAGLPGMAVGAIAGGIAGLL